jgi:hypothetical protein
MKSLIIIFLLVLLYGSTLVSAQNSQTFLDNITRVIIEKEPDWQGGKINSPVGTPGPDTPRGSRHDFEWRRKDQTIHLHILYGDSDEDAVKQLEWSQRLQINESKPLEGIGEQAYQHAKYGCAWITFRKGNVFAQIIVGLIDIRTDDKTSPEMARLTEEALEIAKRFAVRTADQI